MVRGIRKELTVLEVQLIGSDYGWTVHMISVQCNPFTPQISAE